MKKHRTNVFGCFLIFFLAITLSGCNLSSIIEDVINEELKQEDEENTDGEKQLVTAKIDGRDFSNSGFGEEYDGIIVSFSDANPDQNFLVIGIAAMNLPLHKEEDPAGISVGLSMLGPNFSSLAKGTVFKPAVTVKDRPFIDDFYVLGLVREDLENDGLAYEANTEGLETIEVVITEIDHQNKRISGKFEFTAYDVKRDRYVKVTDGVFKNILLVEGTEGNE